MPTNLVYEDASEGGADEVDVTEAVMEMLERDNGPSREPRSLEMSC